MTFSHQSRWSPTSQSDPGHSSVFAEQGWGLEPQSEMDSQDQPDLQAQLDRATRLGHRPQHYSFVSGVHSIQTRPDPTSEARDEEDLEETSVQPKEIASAAGDPSESGAAGSTPPPETPLQRADRVGHHFSQVSVGSASASTLQTHPINEWVQQACADCRQERDDSGQRRSPLSREQIQRQLADRLNPQSPPEALLQRKEDASAAEPAPEENPLASDPDAFVSDFQQALLDNTLARLQTNRSRLESANDPYQNADPANPQWKHLRELSDADHRLDLKQGQLGQSLTQLLEQLTLSKPAWSGIFTIPAQGSFEARRQQILSYLQGTADPETLTSEAEDQVHDLLDKLDLAEETQRMLRAEYPAVAVLDSGSVKDLPNTGEINQQLQEQMQQRFTQIQAQIDELSEKLQESPHLALHLDVMVSETLAQQGISEEGRQAGEQNSEAVLDWIEGEKQKDALSKLDTTGLC